MALLRMLNRSAFICNVCFLLAILMLRAKHSVNPGLASLVIVMGFALSIILNLWINTWHLVCWAKNKPLTQVPRLLVYVNGGFLIIQLIFLLK
jgi:hypothetical protein